MDERKFWSFLSKDDGASSELHIDGEIASYESWWFDVTTPKRFQRELNAATGPLTVWINSPGGDAFAGAEIYTALRRYAEHDKVTVKVGGIAASAASVIAMAGDEVLISPVGTIMIHDPWTWLSGNADDLRQNADVLDEIAEGHLTAYVRKTGKTAEEIRTMMKSEKYMNARSAIAEGFADGLIFEEEKEDGQPEAKAWQYSRSEYQQRFCALMRAREKPPQEDPPPDPEPPDDTAQLRLKLLALASGGDE